MRRQLLLLPDCWLLARCLDLNPGQFTVCRFPLATCHLIFAAVHCPLSTVLWPLATVTHGRKSAPTLHEAKHLHKMPTTEPQWMLPMKRWQLKDQKDHRQDMTTALA
ncbi:hypothetical protein ACLKA6_013338 [Drosophila palustris]